MASILTVVGLVLNLIGTWMLLKASTDIIFEEGDTCLTTKPTDKKGYKIGFQVLFFGFLMQIIGVSIPWFWK